MKHKTHNEGFSLLEVIISIAIIGIVFVSLMQYFSSSIRANNYAKSVQKSTLAAQTVMEDLKRLPSIEMIAKEFNGITVSTSWTELETDGLGGYVPKFPTSYSGSSFTPSDTYYFSRDITIDGTNYTALIILDTAPYRFATANSQFNALEIAQVQDINSSSNAILVELTHNNQAVNQFRDEDNRYCIDQFNNGNIVTPLSETDIRTDMTRELVINITPSGSSQIRIEAYYQYQCPSYSARFGSIRSASLYDVYTEKVDFASLYYFYYPFRTSEKIIINDSTDKTYDLHLVCQGTPPSSANIVIQELLNRNSNTIYSNVEVSRNGSSSTPDLFEEKPKQRYADVTIQIFEESQPMISDNVLAEIKTTRGE